MPQQQPGLYRDSDGDDDDDGDGDDDDIYDRNKVPYSSTKGGQAG